MSVPFRSAFFAYPGGPSDLTTPIEAACSIIAQEASEVNVTAWPKMNVFGASIPEEVRENIKSAHIVICDVTIPNLNVYYEAGFAIGAGKALAPVVNASFDNAISNLQRDGIFDNIGYKTYENSEDLASLIRSLPASPLAELYAKPVNFQQPLFLLDTFRKTDFRNAMIAGVEASGVFYRIFDPVEIPRFSTVAAIAEATASAGIVIPLLADHVDDSARHNLRAAFLAGLGHGLGRKTLLVELNFSGTRAPADYRDMISHVRSPSEIEQVIVEFAQEAVLQSQSIDDNSKRIERTALQRLSLGASAAENEFRTLSGYFVETSEFLRTLRGEVSIVAGRKGSGKTAIFFQVRDQLRRRKNVTIIDLKPESHQLSLFREELTKVVGAGSFDHTLAAFWYFVILSELLITIRARIDVRGRRDAASLASSFEIASALEEFDIGETGDFTLRINKLGRFVVDEIKAFAKRGESLSPERLTNIIYRTGVTKIRDLITKHGSDESDFVLLFDNIDKGWPTSGVDQFDIRLVRLLVETLDKVRRDFSTQGRSFSSVVFLRNDIYELMIEGTPDRGKAGQVRIDWTDRAKLRQVIYKRLRASAGSDQDSFESIWGQFFGRKVGDVDMFDYFVNHCLMRPRFLINIIEYAIANAINRGNDRVEENDAISAVRQHSHYLIDDFGYEIRDVSGLSADILYAFVGTTRLLTKDEVIGRFEASGIDVKDLDRAFGLMLWYGVLGIACPDGQYQYIYDFEYNMKRLDAEINSLGADCLYVTNEALHLAMKR